MFNVKLEWEIHLNWIINDSQMTGSRIGGPIEAPPSNSRRVGCERVKKLNDCQLEQWNEGSAVSGHNASCRIRIRWLMRLEGKGYRGAFFSRLAVQREYSGSMSRENVAPLTMRRYCCTCQAQKVGNRVAKIYPPYSSAWTT